jgi:hypothetical protein
MWINRTDVADREGHGQIPMTALGMDDAEFDEIYNRLKDIVDLRKTAESGTEWFVVCYEKELQWLYDAYSIIGGDILFYRGPLPAGQPSGQMPPEWHPRKVGASPLALAMITSDSVFTDPGTGKTTILGTFSAIVGREFPLPFPKIMVYLALTDARGRVPLRLRLIDADEIREPVQEKEWEIEFSDPVVVVEESVCLAHTVFPESGEYRLQLLSGGELLMERRLLVVFAQEKPQ